VLIAVDDLVLILAPAERTVDEELRALRSGGREAGNIAPGVGDEVRAGFQRESVFLQPLLEFRGPREDANSGALLQAVARLLTDDAGTVVKTVFENGGCGHPQFADFDAVNALVGGGVVHPEELAAAAAMVVVEMGEADHV